MEAESCHNTNISSIRNDSLVVGEVGCSNNSRSQVPLGADTPDAMDVVGTEDMDHTNTGNGNVASACVAGSGGTGAGASSFGQFIFGSGKENGERNGAGGGIIFDPVQVYQPVDMTYPCLTRACASPPVYVVENFLPAELCERLITETSSFLVRAPVVGVGNGEISAARTSSTCYLDRGHVPSVVSRVSQLLQGKPIEHIELPQVGRYLQGEEYKAHFDAFDLNSADGRRFAENGGQRICTVLIYLNDVSSGGQTVFPNLKFALQPKQGRALIFFPATVDGVLDPSALHAAMPAVDPKYVCQVWVRQREYYGVSSVCLPAPI